MSRSDRLALAKAIGEDIEVVAIDVIDGLETSADPEDYFDAVATKAITPAPEIGLRFSSIAIIEAGTRLEIKSCRHRVENGSDQRPGLWMFRTDQHERLLEDNASYLLAVYEIHAQSRDLQQMLIIPASIIDEVLAGSWYGVDRHEGAVAQLSWSHILDPESGGDPACP